MAALVVTSIFLLMAILSPILKRLGVIDPYTPHQDLLDYASGGYPKGFARRHQLVSTRSASSPASAVTCSRGSCTAPPCR